MAGIRTVPEPYCPDCGGRMKLRRPRKTQNRRPFWGCSQWPDCDGTRTIMADGRPEEDDDDDFYDYRPEED